MATATGRKIRVMVQLAQSGATYRENRDAWLKADALGVDIITNCDHFFAGGDPEGMFFEAWSMLAGMAEATTNAQIGVLVTANSYRNPNLLADMARTVDHISGGRCILGIGSGWAERDYTEYGYEFGTPASRLADLARDLPVISERLKKLNPGPVNATLPIMIGGSGEKVTLRLVAEHAHIWHCNGDPDVVRQKASVLDDWCGKVGRDSLEIERSASVKAGQLEVAEDLVAAGFTTVAINASGPAFDLSPLPELLAWRDAKNGV